MPRLRIEFSVCLLVCYWVFSLGSRAPTLIMVDGPTTPSGPYWKIYCDDRDIEIKNLMSRFHGGICGWSPEPGTELEWYSEGTSFVDRQNTFALSSSEPGLALVSRMTEALKLKGTKDLPFLTDKFFVNERARRAGVKTVEQVLARDWKEAEAFISELWSKNTEAGSNKIILKPRRGASSFHVHRCSSLREAESAFCGIIGKPQYGGGTNADVLIQECIEGPEYAVDTVVCLLSI